VASLPDGVVLNGTTLVAPQASEGALTTQGQYFANSSTIYIYSTTAPSSYYSSIEAILRDGIDIGRNYINVSGIATWYGIIGVNENVGGDALNNVNLTNLDSEYNSRQGVLLANLWTELTNPATNLNISYSTVSNNGYHGIHYTFYVTNSICSYNTVNNNGTTPAIASMGGEGIEVYGRNSDVYINHITVTHNTVTNTQSVTTWGEGQGIQSDGYSAYVTISYNTVYGNMGVGIAMTPPSHNATVVYNVVYGNGSALTNEGGISVNDDYGSLIANNTVYNNYGQGFVLWNTSSINTTVKNNIFQANGTTEIEVSTSVTGWLSDYNDYYHPAGGSSYMNWLLTGYTFSGWQSASSQDANSLGSNPMLNNPSGGDFTLQSGSAAINAGACINGVTPCPTNIGAK
jgi:parallel beta-helix repeat protein